MPEGIRKLAIYTSVSNAFDDATDTAYLEISSVQAKALLDLIGHVVEFRKMASALNLTHEFFSVSVGLGDALPQFRVMRIPFTDESVRAESDEPVIELPAAFDPNTISEDDEFRVECHRVEVDQHGVRFTALAKHGDSEFTTEDLTIVLLKAMAEGRDLSIPMAKLESP